METIHITEGEVAKLLSKEESHFLDFKSIEIQPRRLLRTVSALANSDGGELYIGVLAPSNNAAKAWNGFPTIEDANGVIQAIEEILPLGNYHRAEFISAEDETGYVLHLEILKSRDIVETASGEVYIRRGAQNLTIQTQEQRTRLALNKGISSFETETVKCNLLFISNSTVTIDFMLEVVPLTR
jgi:ATP-dependent DNA helicase RecG